MKCAALLAALHLSLCSATHAGTPANWSTNLAEMLKTAREKKQPVLLDFSATWCGPCKRMEQTTLQDQAVLQQLDRFAKVSIDLDENHALAQQHRVEAVPTFLILSADGEEVLRGTGYMKPDQFVRWLTNGWAAHEVFLERQREFLIRQRAVTETLRGSDATARARAVKELLELCCQREPARQRYAVEQIKALAAREPAALLDGLDHPKLATRIQVANALREQFGAVFDFDPWEPSRERQSLIALWKARLSRQNQPGR